MKRHAPSAERNREPIAQVLDGVLPSSGLVLEVASGTGQHAVFYASRYPALSWQPSDPDPDALSSIAAWRKEADLPNLLPPIQLDAALAEWPVGQVDAILCINMVHIAPWAAACGVFAGAAARLGPAKPLIFYGPFLEQNRETAPTNLEFDASLQARNPAWGLRDLALMDEEAKRSGFQRRGRVEMPANNLMLIYRK